MALLAMNYFSELVRFTVLEDDKIKAATRRNVWGNRAVCTLWLTNKRVCNSR
jgi:hypothetical protein